MQLSIIIVNYNVKYFLEHCLFSVIKACKGIEAEILVVDNNSRDNSKNYFTNKFNTVKFYWLAENLGFGKANNYALQFAKGKHILFLNPDTIVGENTFTNCLHFFEINKDCGAVGVRMIDGSGNFLKESKRGFPNTTIGFYKATGLAKLLPKTFGQYHATHLPEKENSKVDVLAGAYMMLSRKAIDITKGFDEDFFMYGEDIDLSYRLKKAGLQNYYLGEETIIHFKGESTAQKSKAYFDNFYNAMKLFIAKHSTASKTIKPFIYFGVKVRKQLALLRNIFSGKEKVITFNAPLIVGAIQEIEAVKKILNLETYYSTNGELFLKSVEDKNIDAIIFCNAEFSYLKMIAFLQAKKNKIVAFYSADSNSIIGSISNSTSGFVFTAEQ